MSKQNVGAMTRRILKLWDAASASDLAEGLAWFNASHEFIKALGVCLSYNPDQTAAGVVAALSPRVSWTNNQDAARKMIAAYVDGKDQPKVAGLPMNRDRAWQILMSGKDPLDILGGIKVRTFYRALMGDPDAVTVDVWAQRAAEGQYYQPHSPSTQQFERIAEAYRLAALERGVTPRDMQAAIWTLIRKES